MGYYESCYGGIIAMNHRTGCIPTRAITTPTKVPANGCAVVPLDIPCAATMPVELVRELLEDVPIFPLPFCVGEMPVTAEVSKVVLIAIGV
jgi:hypothetical protein